MDAVPTSVPCPASLPQPLSFGGVASIACRSPWCLLGWQFLVAALAGAVVAWALGITWGRAWMRSTRDLPERAAIRDGRLEWPGTERVILHQGPFVGFVVEPSGRREAVLASDVTVYFEPDGVAFRSLLGWASLPYPRDLNVALGRWEVAGNMAAWATPAWLAVSCATAFGLLLAWWLLSLAYGGVLWACAGILGRQAGFGGAWRTAGAALLAPALLMTAALLLYATRSLTFVGFLLAVPLHLVAGWLYCAGGLTNLPALPTRSSSPNPFGSAFEAARPAVTEPADTNPFGPS